MSSRPWSRRELAVLERHADRRDWLDRVAPLIPDRSPTALRSRMQLVRADGDGATSRVSEQAWMPQARTASQQLLEQLERTGLRPA